MASSSTCAIALFSVLWSAHLASPLISSASDQPSRLSLNIIIPIRVCIETCLQHPPPLGSYKYFDLNAAPAAMSEPVEPLRNPDQPLQSYTNIMEQNMQSFPNPIDQENNSIAGYRDRIQQLQQKQQILKYSVADHQESVKQLFMTLYTRKQQLLDLMSQEYNNTLMDVDIGLMEQFQQLRRTIDGQQAKIEKLKAEIEMQGLTGAGVGVAVLNDRDALRLKNRKEELEGEIEQGRKFAASQYVRDYLQRTYIHKVSYEQVKYQYEMKIKLKEYLEGQKVGYEKRKDELKKAIEREGATKRELEEEKAKLEYLLQARDGQQAK